MMHFLTSWHIFHPLWHYDVLSIFFYVMMYFIYFLSRHTFWHHHVFFIRFDVMTYVLTLCMVKTWFISRIYRSMVKVTQIVKITIIGNSGREHLRCYDIIFVLMDIMMYFGTSWCTFQVMTSWCNFWHHDILTILLDIMNYFDMMKYFPYVLTSRHTCYDVLLTSMRILHIFWRYKIIV